ncbi:MAG: hypothetical protein LBG90_02235 [Spirochaetaceae bacterium]|jgi:hypothetical protein|nr:hypothetical protein [Spirochaetaceae bacterium]
MKKILSVLALSLVVSGFIMAQNAAPVTKENCTIEYDSAKKAVRLTNKNDGPYTIQYEIDGSGKSVTMDKGAVWEMDFSKSKDQPKAVNIVKAAKAVKAGPVDIAWKAVPAPAGAAQPATKPAPAPATGGTAQPAAKPAPAPKK